MRSLRDPENRFHMKPASHAINRWTPALLASATLVLTTATQALAAPGWDILGIRLGMTEAEVRAAMLAYEPKGQVVVTRLTLPYGDKVSTYQTEPFLGRLELRTRRQTMQTPLKVQFSGPGGAPRVIAVEREAFGLPDPQTPAQFQQSLEAKYGKPSAYTPGRRMPMWEEPGKPPCARDAQGEPMPYNTFKSLEEAQRMQGRAATARPLPADLTTCGAYLQYDYAMSGPVRSFVARLVDLGGLAATEQARRDLVKRLEDEAVRRREGQAQRPRL